MKSQHYKFGIFYGIVFKKIMLKHNGSIKLGESNKNYLP